MKNIRIINETIERRIQELYEECLSFNHFIEEMGDVWAWPNEYTDFTLTKGYTVTFSRGASRGVLIFDDFNYVIKFDFPDYSNDYCIKEMEIFCEANKQNLKSFFAETWYGGSFRGVPYFIMEKATVDTTKILNAYFSSKVNKEVYYEEYKDYMQKNDILFLTKFFGNYYPEQEIHHLLEFCIDYGISDIYEYNVGYIENNPVMIDYAGYE